MDQLLVLESNWNEDTLDDFSVWPFFREFSNVMHIGAHYKTFSDFKTLRHWIDVYDKSGHSKSDKKVLYIASHGSDRRIYGLGKAINHSSIIQILEGCESITHVLFGCCSFGGQDNLIDIVHKSPSLKFASGYEKEIDWIDSTLFDLFVLRMIYDRDSRALHTKMYDLMDQENPKMADKLEFKFAYEYRGYVQSSARLSDYE